MKGMKVVIHEVYDDQHRICIFNEDGTSVVGDWALLKQVAVNGIYFSIVGESPLPQGVFTCREVPFQQLG